MARFVFAMGQPFETLTKPELTEALAAQAQLEAAALVRGVKYARIPLVLTGQPSGGALSLGGDVPGARQVGPAAGFTWEIRRMAVIGLTRGATPDVTWVYRYGGSGSIPVWEFNGNSWAYTFGRGEFALLGTEYLALKSVGAFAATGQITLAGDYIQVPSERYAEILF